MLQLQLQIFAICLSLVSLLFFCCFVALSLFIFAQSLCCSPKQMLPATDFHYTHTRTLVHTLGPARISNPNYKAKPIRRTLCDSLALVSFQDHWQRVSKRGIKAIQSAEGGRGGPGGCRLGVTLRKYVTAFVTHFRVNFLLHPT